MYQLIQNKSSVYNKLDIYFSRFLINTKQQIYISREYSTTNRLKSSSSYNNHNKRYTYNTKKVTSTAKRLDENLNWDKVTVHTSLDPNSLLELQEKHKSAIDQERSDQKKNAFNKSIDRAMTTGNINDLNSIDENDPDDINAAKKKRKTFIKESYKYIPNNDTDDKYIKEALASDEFDEEITERDGWKEWDYDKSGTKTYDEDAARREEAASHGLTLKKDGLLYFEKYSIPPQFEAFFTKPNAPMSRMEKNQWRRVDAKLEAKRQEELSGEKVEKKKPKRKIIVDEDSEEHTVLQKKFSQRILDVLNDSFLFQDNDSSTTMNSSSIHFKNQVNDELEQIDNDEIIDPLLARANITLTIAKMSSDLRWVKVYWTRDKEKVLEDDETSDMLEQIHRFNLNQEKLKYQINSLKDNNNIKDTIVENRNEEVVEEDDDSHIKDELDDVVYDQNEDLSLTEVLSEMTTSGARKYILGKHKQDLPKPDIKSSSSLHKNNKINNIKIIENNDNSNNNNNDDDNQLFSFGKHTVTANIDKVKIDLSIPSLHDSLMEPTKVISSSDIDQQQTRRGSLEDYGFNDLEDSNHRFIDPKQRLYEKITDDQINQRLTAHIPRLRLLIGKNIKTKYVPNIYFLKDTQKKKMDIAIDLYDTIVAPELIKAANETKSLQSKRSDQLKNRFMGIFNSDNNKTLDNESAKENIDDDMYMDEKFANELLKEELELENVYIPNNILSKSTPTLKEKSKEQKQQTTIIEEEKETVTSDRPKIDQSIFKDFNKNQF